MTSFIAVIDIGKTHKKVAIYDQRLRQVQQVQEHFAAETNADGILEEPIAVMWAWFKEQLTDLYRSCPFQAISITTHGASVACLDADGELAVPLIAYDHDLGDRQAAFDEQFYQRCGDLASLQEETGSCDLPLLINPAKALLFAKKHYPEGMARTTRLVNFPQFWGHRLTGRIADDPTYTFNHSFLHDIRSREPSTAAARLGLDHMLGRRFRDPWAQLGTLTPALQVELGLPPLPVTVGIHDSNAALLPYLCLHSDRDFVLNSTGTWCVAMHRVQDVHYRPDELGQKVIFNIDALGGYQKTSFLMGGQDYDLYHTLIGGEHSGFDADRMNQALADTSRAIIPGAFPSQFPLVHGGASAGDKRYSLDELKAGKTPDWFSDQVLAHDLLNISLALQSAVALRRTDISDDTTIFIEGGFRQNPAYLALMAALFPKSTVACTSLEQATSTGAALLGLSMLAKQHPQDFSTALHIEESPVSRPDLPNLSAYAEAFTTAFATAASPTAAV